MSNNALRWGVAGPGQIAQIVAADFAHVEGGDLVFVGSRLPARAEAFAERYGIPEAGSHDELLAADLDAIYVATPHPQHAEIALAAIEAGKAVLVEKAFTTTVADTQRLIDAAQSRQVFLMEAMWTRFLPAIRQLRDLVASGALGEVRAIYGDLLAFREYDPADRLFNPELGGGAVLDLGVYGLSFTQQFLGSPEVIHAVGSRLPNGVEGDAGILLGWTDGRYATQAIGFSAPGPGRQVVAGTKGWVEVRPRFHRARELSVNLIGEEPRVIDFPRLGQGYHYEFTHVGECVRAGLTQSPIMPLADTLAVQMMMDSVLRSLAG